MTSETKKAKKCWGKPTLQAIDMRETAVKGQGPNESGHQNCGPAQGQGSPNCS